MSEREVVWSASDTVTDGPRVGLASYESSDPEATFQVIERARPRPIPRGPGVVTWAVCLLLVLAANLAALVGAGLLLTAVGASDPFPYVAGAVVFGLVNTSLPVSARLLRRRARVLAAAAVLLVANVLLIWLMTVLAHPFRSPDAASIAEAGAVMWAVNLPLGLLWAVAVRRPSRSPV